MSLYRLEVFVCVAKHRHITRAAEELHISQPSVSRHLRALEEEFGIKLHRTNSRGIELTAEGEEFLEAVKSVLDNYDHLTRTFKKVPESKEAQTLTIGSSFAPSVALLPRLLIAFKRAHKTVGVVTQYGPSDDLERKVLDDSLDLALITQNGELESLAYHQVGKGETVAFVSSAHPLAEQKKLAVSDLAKYPLILRARSGKSPTRTWNQLKRLENDGLRLNISMDIESHSAILLAVKEWNGIGFTDRDYVEEDAKRGLIKILRFPGLNIPYEIFLCHASERPLGQAAEVFIALGRWHKSKLPAALPPNPFDNL